MLRRSVEPTGKNGRAADITGTTEFGVFYARSKGWSFYTTKTQSGSPPHATTPFFDRLDALLRRQGRRGPPLDHEVTAAVALVKAGLTAHRV
jgi:hypothetical protein